MRKVFFHLHIPKCGGSTISDFLYRNFGGSLGYTNSYLNDFQYNQAQISAILDHYPHLKCMTGHKLSLDLPFQREDLDITAFSWIRDPIERFISHYFFHRNHTNITPKAKELSLEDYIEWGLEEGNQEAYVNGQIKFLTGGDFSLIEKKVEEGKLLLFSLSKLKESQYFLVQNYPDHFIDWRVRKKNASKKDQEISPALREKIAPFVEKDLRLLELANKMSLESAPPFTFIDGLRNGGKTFIVNNTSEVLKKVVNRLELPLH